MVFLPKKKKKNLLEIRLQTAEAPVGIDIFSLVNNKKIAIYDLGGHP